MGTVPITTKGPKVEERLRAAIRLRHYSWRTEQTYVQWYNPVVHQRRMRSIDELTPEAVADYLNWQVSSRGLGATTHRQALSAYSFLFKEVLGRELGRLSLSKPEVRRRLPVVLTTEETKRLLGQMQGVSALQARLLYGCGLRIAECLRLRIKDVDLAAATLTVRSGKGDRDRSLTLPQSLIVALGEQIERCRALHQSDREADQPGVEVPMALERKYPNLGREWVWFWVFPSKTVAVDPRS